MRWHQEKKLQDVEEREKNRPDTGFLSWSNYIKKHKSDPAKRYDIAQKFLPWPIGFKESVLALRAIIRDKNKANLDYESDLLSLYHLAAWESFCPKQCENIKEPAFKVFEQIPGGIVADLPVDYQQLGYEQLKLLTKTDAKMLVNLYGEPKQHSTLNQLYADIWQQAELDYLPQQPSPKENSDSSCDSNLRCGLNTASKKYNAKGQVVISPGTNSQASKHLKAKIKSNHKAVEQTLAEDKIETKIIRAKQLSGLMFQAVQDRALIKERVVKGTLKNIKQTWANKKLVVLLGASFFVVSRKVHSRNRNK